VTMARLFSFFTVSLDGYMEDRDGDIGFSEPDEEIHQFANDLLRPVKTHLYGRRLYETMQVWETDTAFTEGSAILTEFAEFWKDGDKVVYSRSLPPEGIVTSRTRLERAFDPDAVRAMKEAATADLNIGGADLVAQALQAGLVDEVHLMIVPVVLGGGKPALPDDLRLDLELLEVRRFDRSGAVYLRYRVAGAA
jgi:dihydrofolate reductase